MHKEQAEAGELLEGLGWWHKSLAHWVATEYCLSQHNASIFWQDTLDRRFKCHHQ